MSGFLWQLILAICLLGGLAFGLFALTVIGMYLSLVIELRHRAKRFPVD